ncbi:3-dehydrosphinganine reductase [Nematocida parisii]|uniref:3-dehydrosphinganine reductase n=1 Tax=Nematocida parisii (strain ERTm3) TaxID=935791 RepID=I3EK96_NEMP3|nr:uncharacterized protein NEPG_00822 [Nematocida parisii ERTm1]EIJ89643.1 hypothetical protein NEQG_00413 [Nematocida parisii ERTm3]KAI5126817.1 3-dehydrosphinganine reductase [Nematocida parisii]EIJ94155.1 hypothetical protein NEPG_00822 [Nematocida parisii ERTm1]KAI5126897.1 3-dehydrosphinganine reductase [Nematocida parisii]KAI5141007.1 3-dehydrosphinganine reductase [Nematocida parisii]|eukprot:XP_013058651.1 hypothetical protein NEPG_00822 [Nematocida parisii ERTm1]
MAQSKSIKYYAGKRILIIGGSSGLGLSVAKYAKSRGGIVTITSRSLSKISPLRSEYSTLSVDITKAESVSALPTNFDIIMCCAGYARPSYARDITIKEAQSHLDCNFLGAVRVYLHFLNSVSAKSRKKLVFVASTLALRSFGGYGMYAPSKSALSSFYESVHTESSIHGLDLCIYYVSTIQSPGFEIEQEHKPLFTKKIEGSSLGADSIPESRAKTLLDALPTEGIIYSDFITCLFSKSSDINSFQDFLAWIASPFFWMIFKMFESYTVKKYYEHTNETPKKNKLVKKKKK